MYLIGTTGHSSISTISETREGVYTALKAMYDRAFKQWNPNAYFARTYPTPAAYASYCMKSCAVFWLPVGFGAFSVNQWGSTKNLEDLTSTFFSFDSGSIKTGEHITAKVVKKSLKSFGKTVIINDKVKKNSNVVAPTPLEYKELYDQLARINCTVEKYGNITVAPDSLDDYKVTDLMQEILTLKWAE